jgi:hypothetical protein
MRFIDVSGLARLIEEYFGEKVVVETVRESESEQELSFMLYDAVIVRAAIDPRYGSVGFGVQLGEQSFLRSILGARIALNSDETDLRRSLRVIDSYCRLRLPDKYLDAYDSYIATAKD